MTCSIIYLLHDIERRTTTSATASQMLSNVPDHLPSARRCETCDNLRHCTTAIKRPAGPLTRLTAVGRRRTPSSTARHSPQATCWTLSVSRPSKTYDCHLEQRATAPLHIHRDTCFHLPLHFGAIESRATTPAASELPTRALHTLCSLTTASLDAMDPPVLEPDSTKVYPIPFLGHFGTWELSRNGTRLFKQL
jgi:hypothetical protein